MKTYQYLWLQCGLVAAMSLLVACGTEDNPLEIVAETSLTITNLQVGATVTGQSTIDYAVTAENATLVQVEFFLDEASIGTVTALSGSLPINSYQFIDGEYTLTATATFAEEDLEPISQSVPIVIDNPLVTVTAPVSGDVFDAGYNTVIVAAHDSEGNLLASEKLTFGAAPITLRAAQPLDAETFHFTVYYGVSPAGRLFVQTASDVPRGGQWNTDYSAERYLDPFAGTVTISGSTPNLTNTYNVSSIFIRQTTGRAFATPSSYSHRTTPAPYFAGEQNPPYAYATGFHDPQSGDLVLDYATDFTGTLTAHTMTFPATEQNQRDFLVFELEHWDENIEDRVPSFQDLGIVGTDFNQDGIIDENTVDLYYPAEFQNVRSRIIFDEPGTNSETLQYGNVLIGASPLTTFDVVQSTGAAPFELPTGQLSIGVTGEDHDVVVTRYRFQISRVSSVQWAITSAGALEMPVLAFPPQVATDFPDYSLAGATLVQQQFYRSSQLGNYSAALDRMAQGADFAPVENFESTNFRWPDVAFRAEVPAF